jgi:YwiC-like protein
VGVWSGGEWLRLLPLAITAVALFWLRTPVESWLGTSPLRAQPGAELRRVQRSVAVLSVIALAPLVWIFWAGRYSVLAWIGAAAAAAFLIQTLLKRAWRRMRMIAQMIGAAGLTATAPAAYCVATGAWNRVAVTLWIANLLFAVNQIHFVQLRIHSAKMATCAEKVSAGRVFLVGQLLLVIALAVTAEAGAFPLLAAIAFVPLLGRGFIWFARKPAPLAVRALGWSELSIGVMFGLLLVWGVRGIG